MKFRKILSLALAALMAMTLVVANSGVTVSAAIAEYNAVEEPVPADNVLYKSDFDTSDLAGVNSAKNIEQIMTSTGGYMQISKITTNYSGFTISNPRRAILDGTYKFTGYFRMMYDDEVTALRLTFKQYQGLKGTSEDILEVKVYPTSHQWMKVELYIEVKEGFMFEKITVCGDANKDYVQSYCIDNFSLVKVDAKPSGYTPQTSFGKEVKPAQAVKSQVDSLLTWPKWDEKYESQFDVQGVIVNHDNTIMSSFQGSGGNAADIQKFALGFKGSHVTDYMICISTTVSMFPSNLETWTDLVDKYHQKTENGIAVDYSQEGSAKAAYQHFISKGIDYIDIMCDTFPTIGINPWLSIRMNDLHDHGEKTSVLLSDYYHANPQYRRVQHGKYAAGESYYSSGLDFAHEEVRQRMLDYINEALSRYNCYGLELDFQREIWIWAHGGEYVGLDILNDFFREVDRIISVYEAKYGHEIQLGLRCTSDIETNYDFGFDILTWAAEGILDLVIPTGRYQTTDTNIPVAEWVSLLHPYGVTVAPCIEQYIDSGLRAGHTLQTYNGMAAVFLSQGADKIALYNQYISTIGNRIEDKHKVSTTDNEVAGTWRHWVIVSTIGSYEKLMTLDRRVILTYNDTHMIWRNSDRQLPTSASAGETIVLRIPIGDIPEGSTVTLKFSANAQSVAKRPTVYVNSQAAEYITMELCDGNYSNQQLLCYNVPKAAHDDMYLVVEIIPQRSLTVDHCEVLIKGVK